ncbi:MULTISPECIES: D-arabinono-1,4-lactone oxidase [Novosphingobium]|uniref:D-arabinono-1,4-lactone oxidase n=1 Tax=Novosphingobium cyanobacteriorum TaxID=3024215 RepID=A0ABT6CPJ2_9SPHN|nr:D-arabinono-1,4-lactone oxidase [Novosphingobium cyanobacteriorum]MDF8335841.1 D-arabinono-1,4-lactone oxidase [Novosphingobium cyanobacteriorum]
MEWHNWSGSVNAQPQTIVKPRDEAELRAAILAASKVRVRGAGHSFMPLCETGGTLIDMSDYAAPVEIAADRASAWVPAGWSLARLTEALWSEGLSLINQGDVNPQSLAGATATGTHGTGKDLGSLSTQVLAFELMLADGSLVICDAQTNPDLFQAQRISLGLFGVATRIRINVLPAYYLEERVEARPLGEMAERWQELAAATRHFEFFVFPYADTVIFKSLQPVAGEGVMPRSTDIDERPFRIACELSRKANFLIPSLQRLMMRLSSKPSRRVGPAWQIFPGDRTIRFEEMEYELPRADGMPTLLEAVAYIRRKKLPVAFPFEFRLVAEDDIWMSPFNRGPGSSISFHQYARMPWRDLFAEIEPVLRGANGRPHWAKRHTLRAEDVHALYPRTGDFLKVRAEVDPAGKFVNADLARLFGI